MTFKINSSDIKLILVAIHGSDLTTNFKDAKSNWYSENQEEQYIVDLNNKQIAKVLDLLSDYLIKAGLSDDGNINELGYQIEAVIDKFSTGS